MLHTALTAVAFVAQVGLGVMFLWSAAGKVWEWSLFQSTIEGLGLTSTVAGPAAGLLIAAEFSLGALVAVGQYPAMATIGVLLLLVLFALVGLYAEQRGLSLSCSCFGRARTKQLQDDSSSCCVTWHSHLACRALISKRAIGLADRLWAGGSGAAAVWSATHPHTRPQG